MNSTQNVQAVRRQEAVRMKRESLTVGNDHERLTWAVRKSLKVDTQFFFAVCFLLDDGKNYNWTNGFVQLEGNTFYFSKESNARASVSRKEITSLDNVSCMNSDKKNNWMDGIGVYLKMVTESSADLKVQKLYIRFESKLDLYDFLKLLSKQAIVHNVYGYLMANNMESLLTFDSQNIDVDDKVTRRNSMLQSSRKMVDLLSDDGTGENLHGGKNTDIEVANVMDVFPSNGNIMKLESVDEQWCTATSTWKSTSDG